jgi:hypothetical protein
VSRWINRLSGWVDADSEGFSCPTPLDKERTEEKKDGPLVAASAHVPKFLKYLSKFLHLCSSVFTVIPHRGIDDLFCN